VKTISDLKRHLASSGLSPETLARDVKISNMTIRRLLQRPDSDLIPEKYLLQFQRSQTTPEGLGAEMWTERLQSLFNPAGGKDFEQLWSDLEESGKTAGDYQGLQQRTKKKLLDPNLGRLIKDQVKTVMKALFTDSIPLRLRLICAGALLYFINPMDLIPDTVPVVGYLDDFAIMSLVVGALAKLKMDKKT